MTKASDHVKRTHVTTSHPSTMAIAINDDKIENKVLIIIKGLTSSLKSRDNIIFKSRDNIIFKSRDNVIDKLRRCYS